MKAFRFRCFPNKAQQEQIQKTFGCCRFVWNHLVDKNRNNTKVNLTDVNKQLLTLKANSEYKWLYDVSSVALQQVMGIFIQSFNSIGKAPKFKSKHSNKGSFRITGGLAIRLSDGLLFLPKDHEPLPIKWTRQLPSKPTSYTISKTSDGKFWVSFLCKEFVPTLTGGSGIIGIDLGLKDLVVDSNGNKYKNPRYYHKSQKALIKAHRILSRRKKNSKRREKARIKLAKLYAKVANQRKDYIHNLTRKLVNENQVIGIEDLHVRGIKKNKCLVKNVMDSGLGMFKYFLEYKARESAHTVIVKLNRWEPSTQTCNACGEKVTKKLTLSTREWVCEFCGALHDRDVNAGINIKHVAKFMIDNYKPIGGTLIMAPPLLQLLRSLPRTSV